MIGPGRNISTFHRSFIFDQSETLERGMAGSGAKVLVVLMNKDNAAGLRRALETLVRQEGCRICECFNVLILDGASKDNSADIAEDFIAEYPCIRFKVQEVPGGVGPARLEAVRYAMEKGYEYILWGDSENVYSPRYVAEMLSSPPDCDIVSGRSLVVRESVWSDMFFWYHAYHEIIPGLYKRHSPGNNKLAKVATAYREALYPPSKRSDDFYYTLIVLRKGLGVRYCLQPGAVVRVSMPRTYEEVKGWQSSRVKGLIEAAIMVGDKRPPDLLPWSLYSLTPFIGSSLMASSLALPPPISPVALVLGALVSLTPVVFSSIIAGRSRNVYEGGGLRTFPYVIVGTLLHGFMTLRYYLRWRRAFKGREKELREKCRRIVEYFGFRPETVCSVNYS